VAGAGGSRPASPAGARAWRRSRAVWVLAAGLALVLLAALAVACEDGRDRRTGGPGGPGGIAACPSGPDERSFPARVAAQGGVPAPILPLAPGNPFTTPLPDSGVPVMDGEDHAAFREELRFLAGLGAKVEQSAFSASLYVVFGNGDVYDTGGRRLAEGVPFVRPEGPIEALNAGIDGRGWPIAGWMQPDPGEGHMAVYNPETGAYGEFIHAEVGDGFLRYSWGGFIDRVADSLGTSTRPNEWWGATAHGLNLMSFTITDHEMRRAVERYRAGDHENAYIPHILGFEAHRHHPNEWWYPATKTDGVSDDPAAHEQLGVPAWGVGGDPDRLGNGLGVLRMGGIVRLSPDVDVQREVRGDGTPDGDMLARIIARTLQRYGATMTDQTDAGFALLAEHVARPDGTRDAFSYGTPTDETSGNLAWLQGMLMQATDNDWIQFVDTGRHLEADTGGAPPEGVYRPPC